MFVTSSCSFQQENLFPGERVISLAFFKNFIFSLKKKESQKERILCMNDNVGAVVGALGLNYVNLLLDGGHRNVFKRIHSFLIAQERIGKWRVEHAG